MTVGHGTMRVRDGAWAAVAPLIVTAWAAMLVVGFGLPGITAGVQERALLTGIMLGSILSLVFGVMSARRRSLQPGTRRAWWFISSGFVALNLLPVGLAMSGQPGTMQTGGATWADLFRLVFAPLAVVGLLLFPRRAGSRRVQYKIAFDMVTVLGGVFMVLWYFVIGPTLQEHDLSFIDLMAAVAYPIGDLVMLFGMLSVLMHGVDQSVRRPLSLLAGGMAFLIANDVYLGYLKGVSNGVAIPVDRWQYGSVAVAMGLFSLAGVEQCRRARIAESAAADRGRTRRPSQLPYLALGLGYGLLVLAAVHSALFPWSGLIVGSAIMTTGVVARQVLALRENHALVVSDNLTGLANRLSLHESLDEAFERSHRSGRAIAVMLLDMDGFKQVNDTMGHEAGDQMLVGFAQILKASVLGSDTVARQGGDEFAIVLPSIGTAENAEAVAARILEGMRRPILIDGQLVEARASIGIALGTPATTTPADLLRHADVAMYQAKETKHLGSGWRLYADDPATADPAAQDDDRVVAQGADA